VSIVLIDSNHEESDSVKAILRQGGYTELIFAKDADDLENKLGVTTRPPDISIFGIDLIVVSATGSKDALDNVRRIRESFHHQDIPLIVIGDNASPDMIQMAFAFGASDYCAVPLRDYEFLCRVRSLKRLKHEIERRKARERELLEVTRQLSDLNSLLTRLSLIDSLTGIANRRCFDKSMTQEWNRGLRASHPLSLVMIDVDCFKSYNDTYGHQAGDDCLKEVVAAITESLRRPADLVCRYGGEEMAVLLPDTPAEGAIHVAERVRQFLGERRIPHRSSTVSSLITVSQGIATIVPCRNTSVRMLIAAADAALYKAKSEGRNCVRQGEIKAASTQSKLSKAS
jgi:diguanylate cyclase (GGDEF)-like protein